MLEIPLMASDGTRFSVGVNGKVMALPTSGEFELRSRPMGSLMIAL